MHIPMPSLRGQSLWIRCIYVGAFISFIILTYFLFDNRSSGTAKYVIKPSTTYHAPPSPSANDTNAQWEFVVERDADNHGLSEEQCRIAFPKLYFEIDKSAAFRENNPITFKELDSIPIEDGMVRGMIHHGEVCSVPTLVTSENYPPPPLTRLFP